MAYSKTRRLKKTRRLRKTRRQRNIRRQKATLRLRKTYKKKYSGGKTPRYTNVGIANIDVLRFNKLNSKYNVNSLNLKKIQPLSSSSNHNVEEQQVELSEDILKELGYPLKPEERQKLFERASKMDGVDDEIISSFGQLKGFGINFIKFLDYLYVKFNVPILSMEVERMNTSNKTPLSEEERAIITSCMKEIEKKISKKFKTDIDKYFSEYYKGKKKTIFNDILSSFLDDIDSIDTYRNRVKNKNGMIPKNSGGSPLGAAAGGAAAGAAAASADKRKLLKENTRLESFAEWSANDYTKLPLDSTTIPTYFECSPQSEPNPLPLEVIKFKTEFVTDAPEPLHMTTTEFSGFQDPVFRSDLNAEKGIRNFNFDATHNIIKPYRGGYYYSLPSGQIVEEDDYFEPYKKQSITQQEDINRNTKFKVFFIFSHNDYEDGKMCGQNFIDSQFIFVSNVLSPSGDSIPYPFDSQKGYLEWAIGETRAGRDVANSQPAVTPTTDFSIPDANLDTVLIDLKIDLLRAGNVQTTPPKPKNPTYAEDVPRNNPYTVEHINNSVLDRVFLILYGCVINGPLLQTSFNSYVQHQKTNHRTGSIEIKYTRTALFCNMFNFDNINRSNRDGSAFKPYFLAVWVRTKIFPRNTPGTDYIHNGRYIISVIVKCTLHRVENPPSSGKYIYIRDNDWVEYEDLEELRESCKDIEYFELELTKKRTAISNPVGSFQMVLKTAETRCGLYNPLVSTHDKKVEKD